MKESIVKNITQVLLIVFSVVLGLFLSERIEERKQAKEAANLLSKIKSEVNENKKLLEDWTPYHQEVVKTWDRLYDDEQFLENFTNDPSILYSEVFTRETILERVPSSDAWDIAKSHPLIVNIDYDELFILSKIYNQQKLTFDPFQDILQLVRSPEFNSKEKAKFNLKMLKSLMQEIIDLELQLIGYYNQSEEILKL